MSSSPSLLLWPGPEKADRNAYIGDFASSLADKGFAVHGFSLRRWAYGFGEFDALVVHWPESAARSSLWMIRQLTFRAFLLSVAVFRSRGNRVVWVFHNATPHAKKDLPLHRFARKVDCLLSPSRVGLASAIAQYPSLSELPTGVSRLGRFAQKHTHPEQPVTRSELGLPDKATVLLHFGYLRRYKGLESLVTALSELPRNDIRLVVAGEVHDDSYASELTALVAAADDDRVVLDLDFLSRERLAAYLAVADGAVFPFSEVLHSASAMLARSAGLPVLVPAIGALPEYADLDPGLTLYQPSLTGHVLEQFAAQSSETGTAHEEEWPVELCWESIGAATASALYTVLGKSRTELADGLR